MFINKYSLWFTLFKKNSWVVCCCCFCYLLCCVCVCMCERLWSIFHTKSKYKNLLASYRLSVRCVYSFFFNTVDCIDEYWQLRKRAWLPFFLTSNHCSIQFNCLSLSLYFALCLTLTLPLFFMHTLVFFPLVFACLCTNAAFGNDGDIFWINTWDASACQHSYAGKNLCSFECVLSWLYVWMDGCINVWKMCGSWRARKGHSIKNVTHFIRNWERI